jgi:dimethylamine/trimethylamine dehydrogenase
MNGPTQAPIPGAELPFVHTPEQVSAAKGSIDGERFLIYDTDGYFTAVAMAQMLTEQGKQVRVVTPFASFAQYMFFTGEAFRVNRELRAEGVEIVPAHVVSEIVDGGAKGQSVWAPAAESWEADAIVLVTQREPIDGVYSELIAERGRWESEGIEAVHRIGDCVAPRLIADCIFDGHRLAREIDSRRPSVPLPFVRETPAAPTLAAAGMS